MKPGDLVRFTHKTSTPFHFVTHVGIFISARPSRWDTNNLLYKFLTPDGVKEVPLGFGGTSWEVLSEAR
jgi:hypothetical protein